MKYTVCVQTHILQAEEETLLLDLLRRNRLAPEAPCGGNGTCGKCKVLVNGHSVLSCQYTIHSDITVDLPHKDANIILTSGLTLSSPLDPIQNGYLAAFDIGTTTVVCFLMTPEGKEAAVESMLNPQQPYGADVVSRIQYALKDGEEALTREIRIGMTSLIHRCCEKAGVEPTQVGVISVVANSCMQQLFMGIPVNNLATVPFAPVLTKAAVVPGRKYLPICPNAALILVPDTSGYVGADTMGCILATRIYAAKDVVLIVDIGTNGEMVLSHGGKMVACSAAAGPALEGANIRFGMRGNAGAIDHVTKDGFSVIGGREPVGICGSGIIDAVAVMLDKGLLNKRGRILTEDYRYYLTDTIYLTQDDIRQVQMAKGAIAAGIYLMAEYLEISVDQIDRVILAGAFGTFMNPNSACRIGLIPEQLREKIIVAGNIAGSGSKLLALNQSQIALSQELVRKIDFLELAGLPNFQRCFAQNMSFHENPTSSY